MIKDWGISSDMKIPYFFIKIHKLSTMSQYGWRLCLILFNTFVNNMNIVFAHKCLIWQASTVLHQQMATQNFLDLVVTLHQQPEALAANQSTTSTLADPQKEMELVRTYTKEWSEQHQALKWYHNGKRRGGRPKNTWRRDQWKTICSRWETIGTK